MPETILKQWRSVVGVLLVICLLVLSASPLMAQTASTGDLSGKVTDPSGAVIANATVTAMSTSTGQTRTDTTGSDGIYKFNLLPPGTYRVKFEAAGFKTVEIPSATVNVTETEVLDRALEVGAQSQEVTVQADVETIQTESSALGTVVNSQAMTDIPLSTRNYTNILAMSAGANSDVNNATTMGKGSTNITVGGGGTAQNTYLQDGVVVNNWDSLGGTVEGAQFGAFAIPNPDAIAEFKIQTSSYDAGYGRNPGANVNVITKSVTNDFHGTAFEFFRNTVLNANDWFRDFTGGSRLVLNQNQYGGVFGGPIKKDKLFIFVSYQETWQKSGAAPYSYSVDTLPPIPSGNRGTCPVSWTALTQCNAAAQAFVPALGAAICPTNNPGNTKDTTSVGGVQVACNGLNINPVAVNILQLRLANGNYLIPGSTNGQYQATTFTLPALFKDHQAMGNWDYLIDSKNTLSGRYEYERDPLLANFSALNGITPVVALPGSPVTSTKTDDAAVLRLTSVLSNSLVNEARIAYQRYVSNLTEGSPFSDSQVGVTDLSPGVDYLSNFTVSGLFSFGASQSYNGYVPENQFE